VWSTKLWELWYGISVADLNRSPAAILGSLTRLESQSLPAWTRDLRWALEEFARSGALHINCGSREDYQSSDGKRWAADRFYDGGTFGNPRYRNTAGGADFEALLLTERYFPPRRGALPGYRIPLPRGTYKVTLHIAEVHYNQPGVRVFDLLLEGEKILEDYEPLAGGYGVARAFERQVSVNDGYLDVECAHKKENPKISAIEVDKVER
jgi:hypothetical protein